MTTLEEAGVDWLSNRRPLVLWDTVTCPPLEGSDYGSTLKILQTSFSLSNRARVVAFVAPEGAVGLASEGSEATALVPRAYYQNVAQDVVQASPAVIPLRRLNDCRGGLGPKKALFWHTRP